MPPPKIVYFVLMNSRTDYHSMGDGELRSTCIELAALHSDKLRDMINGPGVDQDLILKGLGREDLERLAFWTGSGNYHAAKVSEDEDESSKDLSKNTGHGSTSASTNGLNSLELAGGDPNNEAGENSRSDWRWRRQELFKAVSVATEGLKSFERWKGKSIDGDAELSLTVLEWKEKRQEIFRSAWASADGLQNFESPGGDLSAEMSPPDRIRLFQELLTREWEIVEGIKKIKRSGGESYDGNAEISLEDWLKLRQEALEHEWTPQDGMKDIKLPGAKSYDDAAALSLPEWKRRRQESFKAPKWSSMECWSHKNVSPLHSRPTENYTEVFLSHVRLWVFAKKLKLHSLKELTLSNLHGALGAFHLYPERVNDIATLIQYTYEHMNNLYVKDDEEEEEVKVGMRELLMDYVDYELESLMPNHRFRYALFQSSRLLRDFRKMLKRSSQNWKIGSRTTEEALV